MNDQERYYALLISIEGLPERHLRDRLAQYKAIRESISRHTPEYEGAPQHKNPDLYAFNRAVRRVEDELRAKTPLPAPAAAPVADHLKHLAFVGFGATEKNDVFDALLQKFINLRLLMSLYLMEMRAKTPLYYFWLLAEPAIQVTVIVAVYTIFGRTLVLDMPALPFAVVGVSGILMFRSVMNRMTVGMGRDANLLSLPRISVFDVYLARALHMGLIYMAIGALYLYVLYLFGTGGAPEDPLRVLGWWAMIWSMGFGFGLTLGGLMRIMPWIRRLNIVIFRFTFMTSGVFYVSEQLPDEIKRIVIWNPLLHMFQNMRDAYFWEYSTKETSFAYPAVAAILMLFVGLMNLRREKIGD